MLAAPTLPAWDWRRVRAALAMRRISYTRVAEVANLNREHTCRILCGALEPGEIATDRITRALATLGIPTEEVARRG
jgi:hypothetical protein